MKKILLLFAFLVVSFQAQSQTIPGTNPVQSLSFHTTTINATDSTIMFYAPFNMNVISVQSIASRADTGSATPSATVTLYKIASGIASTANVTWTITAPYTLGYGTPASSTLAKLAKGSTYKIKYTLSTGDTLANVNTILWYSR